MTSAEFESTVKAFIEKSSLLDHRSGKPIISALSGGADSVALLVCLKRLGYNCIAAHCNFHLRGDESDGDETFSRDIADKLNVRFEAVHFNVRSYIESCEGTKSVEMACRELRYAWFEQMRVKYDAQAISVAHNADDNIETMALNLLRGTGLTGIRGMRPVTDRMIVRPLLGCYRNDIETYLNEIGLTYRTDSTNLMSVFKRNAIRNEIMPVILTHFPNAKLTLTNSLHHIQENEAFYCNCLDEKKRAYVDENGNIDIQTLRDREPSAPLLLYEWLREYGFSRSDTDNMLACRQTGSRFQAKERTFIFHKGILRNVVLAPQNLDINECFVFEKLPIADFNPCRDNSEAYFDADKFDMSLIRCRAWVPGDKIRPYGMHGHKKLSDLFADAGVPVDQRARIPLLIYGEDIIWVPGIRASAILAITKETKQFVRVRVRPGAKFISSILTV